MRSASPTIEVGPWASSDGRKLCLVGARPNLGSRIFACVACADIRGAIVAWHVAEVGRVDAFDDRRNRDVSALTKVQLTKVQLAPDRAPCEPSELPGWVVALESAYGHGEVRPATEHQPLSTPA